MSNTQPVRIRIKCMSGIETRSVPFNCTPDHRLIDVIKSFLMGIDFSVMWFEFYDSRGEWLFDTKQTVADYLKANAQIILYKKKVALKFRVLQDPTFTDWCLNHGRKIDNGPIPEIGRNCGFDSEMTLQALCEQFGDKNGFSHHRLKFFNSDGQDIFESLPRDVNLGKFFEINGPMIFYTYQTEAHIDYFYLNASHDPHSVPKRFEYVEGMTVDDLSRTYNYRHSSLLAIENGDIVGFADASDPVQEILDDHTTYRLGDFHDSHDKSEDHFDVSVQFENGGDKFMNPVLVCAMHNETIKSFSERLLAKIVEPDCIAVCLKSLRINIGGTTFKCNSTVKLNKPPASDTSDIIVFCMVDAAHLPPELKYCDYKYEFYFYDKKKPWHRVKFCYTKVTACNPEKLLSVIDQFIEWKKFTLEKCEFFDSRGIQIESKSMQSTVAQYARKNDLVIFYVKTSSD
ncbi:uncharacterized protein LOC129576953 [Sitodiplosis mosellana]|uniref:uncharacterized protein LOC129576953 n=1 Tax=Sitodiplosis mosellana TaxID=263140 RepID=UPI002443D0A2|nr:uncharacterized protein LOC129576953 [Sitodiplosis mosellana]